MFGLTDEDLEITLLCDREMSGEIIFRPGIDEYARASRHGCGI